VTDGHPFSTRRGQKLRRLKLTSHPLCERCVRRGRVTEATRVHHVHALEHGGAPHPPLEELESL
jgi:5-methylcytosine-specific restriction endonuclease McrA